ncbi:Uncharacterized protein QJS10_CPB17g02345 [Acorus calamus]|uniref:Leucine-rich repeat-containing N-terminal plant-type domain-containing protein n=1 Tax=Acorus calamus TaxID=4465 RepID=A0AAV9CWD6_ACOCL|nr:Uncharacterized protein QJS10_CPB17g02345 [Acorus calamus]
MSKILPLITLLVLLSPNLFNARETLETSISPTPLPYQGYPPPLDPKLVELREVILHFKSTITCDPKRVTETWCPETSPCKYKGFYCGHPPKENHTTTVASIDFNGFGLCAPTVSGFLDKFVDLALFHVNSNNFSGTVPDVSKLRYLYELDVSNNKLSGNFPMAVFQIKNPVFLDLRYNNFCGYVPPEVFTLPLDVLFINNNAFDQSIPSNLGASPVAYLTLANNRFTGSLPTSIKNVSSTLKEILFLNNNLTGCLPYEIGYLNKATVFDVGGNSITGQIPCSFGCLKSIQQLNLAGNLIYGMVPEEVCALGGLRNLSLSDNYFTEIGPVCESLVGTVLNIDKNCIYGFPNQRSPEECYAFLSRPKYCPTIDYVPCKAHSYGTPELPAAPPPAHSPTYSALVEHNHRRLLSA